MTDPRIIYPDDFGGVAVIIPAPECGLTVEEIAAKDVPEGKPYRIVDVADIPSDRTFRAAWEADIAEPDGVGADYGAGSVWAVKKYGADGSISVINQDTGEERIIE